MLNTSTFQTYMLCGWHTRCDLDVCGANEIATDPANIDVRIVVASERSPLPEFHGKFLIRHSLNRSLIGIRNVAGFEISMGRRIRIWPSLGSTRKDIEVYLFGVVWASLCHQRKTLPLHSSAVLTKNGIVGFLGNSGSGKSSLAAFMTKTGLNFVADDILPIRFAQTEPGAWPYLRRMKLRRDSIDDLSFTAAEIVSARLDKNKYFVFPTDSAADEWAALNRLYVLELDQRDEGITIEPLKGADAVRAIVDHTYQYNFVRETRRLGEHLESCALVASQVPVYRVRRPGGRSMGPELGLSILAHIEGTG
jgi:hypothetical protein